MSEVKPQEIAGIPRMLTAKEVGSIFGVSRATIYRWIDDHGFPAGVRYGPQVCRWDPAEVEAWKNNTRDQQRAA